MVFALVLAAVMAGFFARSLFGGLILSPADVLFVSASFREFGGRDYEPANRLLIDPVLQFQPWIERNRESLLSGRLPLWNDSAGCGAPLLANGQSAPFDPFQLIAYLGRPPHAYAWMAAARLWTAGLGMFLLAWRWGLGSWGRWFAGLSFPFCGFVTLWLLFPVTNVAVWMPWLFLAGDAALRRPNVRNTGLSALACGLTFLGGHVQTSAHILLASGLYAGWFWIGAGRPARVAVAWVAGVSLGLTVAAVSILPLAVYLTKSPVWEDRQREAASPLSLTRPRVLDAVCLAVPYVFGSQRRGQPNLARGLGVHNVNESAGGFAGLATLIWLAPHAWRARRGNPNVAFLVAIGLFGFLGAYGFPPVANILRAVPVVRVIDPRRLGLWTAFSLVLLGGIGLDHLGERWPGGLARWWVSLWAAAALGLAVAAVAIPTSEGWLTDRAERHYAHAAESTEGADPATYQARAARQVHATLAFLPRVLGLAAAQLALMAGLALGASRGLIPTVRLKAALGTLTVLELWGFAYGANPEISPRDDRPIPKVLAAVLAEYGPGARVLGVGGELPPNVAMRYGLADPRNYDSVELTRSLAWFEPLYEPGPASRSSRRTVTWAGVVRARERLRDAGVVAAVSSTRPPGEFREESEPIGAVWLTRLDAAPLISLESSGRAVKHGGAAGSFEGSVSLERADRLIVRQTFDPGWTAAVDGRDVRVEAYRETFLAVPLGPGTHEVRIIYDPVEVRVACATSLGGLLLAAAMSAGVPSGLAARFRSNGLEGSGRSG